MNGPGGALRSIADPVSRPEGWRWEAVAGEDAGGTLERAWRTLALASAVPTFAGPWFALAQRAAFFRRAAPFAVHTLRRNGELVAALPLYRRRGVADRWTALVNDHATCTGLAMRDDIPEVARRVLVGLLASADRVTFRLLHHGGAPWRALVDAAATLGFHVGIRPNWQGDTWLALPSSVEPLIDAMPPGLARDVHRKLDRLRRGAHAEFACVEGGPELAPTLDACFALEAEGWKGFTGTPVIRDPAAARFYRELAHRASEAGQLAIYVLRADGRLIAFRYCLRAGSRLDSLKTSFAPAWARYSPGLLVQFLAARREVEGGVVRSMHLGPPSEHKLRWASGVLPLATLDVYSPRARGRLASCVPRLRARAARLPLVCRVAPRWQTVARRAHELRHELRVRIGKGLAKHRAGGPAR